MFSFIFRILILVVVLSACTSDDSSNSLPGNIPDLVTLNYPSDFPYKLQIGGENVFPLLGILVNGLSSDVAYDFSYSSVSTDVTILASNNSTTGGFFCLDFKDVDNNKVCTGTPNGTSLGLSISGSREIQQNITINLVQSSSPAWISQGTEANPLTLDINENFPYDASVGTGGISYYRIENLTPGARYKVSVPKEVENSTTLFLFDGQFSNPIICEARFDTLYSCIFTSKNTFATVQIKGSLFYGGSNFQLSAMLLSQPNEFEGTWDKPLTLDFSAGELPHLAVIDNYSNYYHITGLLADRNYTLQITSKTTAVDLVYYDTINRSPARNIECSLDVQNSDTERGCTFSGITDGLFLQVNSSFGSVVGGKFIMTLKQEPTNEGTSINPVDLVYSGTTLRHKGQVASNNSYYNISGVTPAMSYLVRISGDSIWNNNVIVYDGDSSFSTPIVCDITNAKFCVVTASSNNLYLSITGLDILQGNTFLLSVSTPPVGENLNLSATANLPYDGQVDEFSSEYTFTGLLNNSNYIINLSNATGDFTVVARNDTLTTVACSFAAKEMGGCMLGSGPNGSIIVGVRNGTINNDPGGYFTIDFSLAPQLNSQYKTLNAVNIPDASLDVNGTGINSEITIGDSLVTGIKKIIVEVFIEHDSPRDLVIELISPNAETVLLAKQRGWGEYINTRFSDYADVRIEASSRGRYNITYRPETPLYLLNGANANGLWTLKITDTIAAANPSISQEGILHGWGLSIE